MRRTRGAVGHGSRHRRGVQGCASFRLAPRNAFNNTVLNSTGMFAFLCFELTSLPNARSFTNVLYSGYSQILHEYLGNFEINTLTANLTNYPHYGFHFHEYLAELVDNSQTAKARLSLRSLSLMACASHHIQFTCTFYLFYFLCDSIFDVTTAIHILSCNSLTTPEFQFFS